MVVLPDFKVNRLVKPIFKMGTWHLEAAKMAIYIFVPVIAFYGYHQVRRTRRYFTRIRYDLRLRSYRSASWRTEW